MSIPTNIYNRTTQLVVDRVTGKLTVLSAGPVGPTGLTGPMGPQGPQGIPGPSLLLGIVETVGDLPGGADLGDGWIVRADMHIYLWDGAAWIDVGAVQGPQGPPGQDADINIIVSTTEPVGDPGQDGTIWFQVVTT